LTGPVDDEDEVDDEELLLLPVELPLPVASREPTENNMIKREKYNGFVVY